MQGITNVLNGITIQWGDQISHQHSRRSCGRIRFDDQNQKTVFGPRRKLRAQSLWNGNGLHRDTEKRPGYMAAFKDCLNNPIYGLRRHGDDGIARQGLPRRAMIPELAEMSPSAERPTDSTSSPTRVLSRPLVSAGFRLLDSTRSTARSVPASTPATLVLSGSSRRTTLTTSLRWRPLRTVTMTPDRHTTPLEVERPPPWMVTMLSWTASIASDMDLDNELPIPEP